ncbi:MAG: metalloregulator ArsR/SmtB family transcription factor [Rhodospirillales bacterium]|nr:metalloregulator ArsR/SmtB family transcription factor [Rhodospirillales bacterium]
MDALLQALRAAAEPSRLRILGFCAEAELTVGELAQLLGQSQPAVSHHLKVLVDSGLVERAAEGNRAFHRLARTGADAELARRLVAMLPTDDPGLALDRERLQDVTSARARAAAGYFRRIAPSWDKLRSLYVDETTVEAELLRLMPAKGIDDFLDIGTGTGRILDLFAKRVTRAHGVDISPDMLAVARANLARARLGNCTVRKGDMYQLPFPAAAFDAAVLHQVLHYAADPGRAIAEAARVLRPDGILLIVDFATHRVESLRAEHHHRHLGLDETDVQGWLRAARLDLCEIVRLPGNPLTTLVWQARRPTRRAATPRPIEVRDHG